MKKKIFFLFLIGFLIVLMTVANAYSVEVAWINVQHREYGDGRNLNRLSFGLVDDQIRYISNADVVKAVFLYDPDGNPVELKPYKFGTVNEIFGSYDFKNSQWRYNNGWEFDSWFSADILASLIPGLYRLKVATTDGKTAERSYGFNKRVSLPVIDSDSIKLQQDSYGNLIWTWRIPIELGQLSRGHKTRARASIDIYTNQMNIGYFSIIIPIHLNFIFIPKEVVQRINEKGDRLELKISLETRDKNNRTYSKPLILERLPAKSS